MLMTEEIKEKLLKADKDNDKIIVKYFFPIGRYTFYALSGREVDDDIVMFGYVLSPYEDEEENYDEYGNVSLKELESIEVRGLKMERDLYFPDGLTVDEVLSN